MGVVGITILIYLVTAICAVAVFTNKLMILVKTQKDSMKNMDDIKINEKQQK